MTKDDNLEDSNKFSGGWWNYRWFECVLPGAKEHKEKINSLSYSISNREILEDRKYYELYEVYYDKNGNVFAWCDVPLNMMTSSHKDINIMLKQIKKATNKTVLRIVNKGSQSEIEDTGKTMRKLKYE